MGSLGGPTSETITHHLSVNLSSKEKIRLGPELTAATLGEIDRILLTQRVVVSEIYGIYDLLGLLTPITNKYELHLQRQSLESAGWDNQLEGELLESSRAIPKEMVLAKDITFPRSFKPLDGLVGWRRTSFRMLHALEVWGGRR